MAPQLGRVFLDQYYLYPDGPIAINTIPFDRRWPKRAWPVSAA
jgi:hypothetical protein